MTIDPLVHEIWDHEAISITDPPGDWLWQGFIAKGNITLLHQPLEIRQDNAPLPSPGALLAHVDISIEMRHPGGDPSPGAADGV